MITFDPEPTELMTSISNDQIQRKAGTGEAIASPEPGQSLTDKITYAGLESGKAYMIKAWLVDAASGSKIDRTDVDQDETASGVAGEWEVRFTFDASSLGGKMLVSFVEVYDESGAIVFDMKDVNEKRKPSSSPAQARNLLTGTRRITSLLRGSRIFWTLFPAQTCCQTQTTKSFLPFGIRRPGKSQKTLTGTAWRKKQNSIQRILLMGALKWNWSLTLFSKMSEFEDSSWIEDFESRIGTEQPLSYVCILDTGINSRHPLLKDVIADEHRQVVNPEWNLSNQDRHGTAMAGICEYFDLIPLMENNAPLILFIIWNQLRYCRLMGKRTNLNYMEQLQPMQQALQRLKTLG